MRKSLRPWQIICIILVIVIAGGALTIILIDYNSHPHPQYEKPQWMREWSYPALDISLNPEGDWNPHVN